METRKALALLAYVALEGEATRDTLAALFWPESDEARAKGSLRRTLTGLRSALGEGVVVSDRRRIRLADDLVASDVSRFRSALSRGRGHGHDDADVCPRCVPHLDLALAEYRGDFMEGFVIGGAPQWEDWARVAAEGLRLECARAAERLAAGHAAAGRYRTAIAVAQKWIELDVLQEPAHRYLMLLHAWDGNRAGAIEAYRRCTAVLDDELGVPPLEETTELYEAILDEDLPPAPGTRRRVRAATGSPVPERTRLVDRRAELDSLDRALERAASGGRVVALRGETWMGKSRLIEEFTARATATGHPVLLARGYEAERMLPFGVVAQWLRAGLAAPEVAAALRSAPAWAVAEAGRLVPDLPGLSGAHPVARPEPLGETRFFEGLGRVMRQAAGTARPVVIVLDDAQWVDDASWSFLSYLVRVLPEAPALLLFAYRSGTALSDHRAAHLLRDVEHSETVTLSPLDAADIRDLVSDAAKATAVVERTGGVPLLVAEHLEDSEGDITSGVRQLMRAQLSNLDGLATQILAAAAVVGGTTDADLLRATSGRSEDEVVAAIEQLLSGGILEVVPDTIGLHFRLDALERLVYDETTPVRRRLLHRRAAAALSDRSGSAVDGQAATAIAMHHRAGGSDEDAAEWYAYAGDLSRDVFAHAEAERSYQEALALGHPDPERLHLALGELRMLAGRYRDALDEFQAAAARTNGETRALAEHRLGEANRRLGRLEVAQRHFELAEPDHPEPASLHADWALLWLRRGDRDRAQAEAARSRAEAEKADEEPALATAHNILGVVAADFDSARSHFELAVGLSENSPEARMAALNGLAHAVAQLGELDRGLELVDEALGLARLVGDRHREAALINHRADLLHRAGRESDSQHALTEAVTLFADLEPGAWEPEVWLLTVW